MIIYDADITGSLKINGSDFNLTSISSSIVTNSSSIASLELVSGSYANSASFASNISANSASIGSLNSISGSYANSASFASSISANSASIGSLNAVSSSYLLNTTDTLTGDLTVTGNIIATTLNVQDVTASVVYSSGSNIFGSSSIDTQQFTGSIKVSGSVDLQAGDATFAGNVAINGNATLGDGTADNHTINGQVFHHTADALGYKLHRTNGGTSILISATGDAEIEFGTDNGSGTNTTQWTIGKDGTDNSFRISNSAALGTSDALTIDSSENATFAGDVTITGGTTNGLNITTSGTQDTIKINRAATSDNAMTKYQTANDDKWIVGLRNTGDDNFRFYSYGTSSDVLTINQSNGNSTFVGDITLDDDLNFSTNGFADISNTGTGAMRFKPSSQTLALTLTGANATFAGNIAGVSASFLGTASSGAALVTIENNSGSTATSYGLLVKGGGNSNAGKIFEVRDSSGNTDLIIKGKGDVGIGTDNPDTQIHNLQKTNDRAGGFYTQLSGNNYGLSMFVNSGGYGIIGSNGTFTTDVLTMDLNSGNVGIGTVSPDLGAIAGTRVLTIASPTADRWGILELSGNRGYGGNQCGELKFISTDSTNNGTIVALTAINDPSATGTGGSLKFQTRANGGSLSEKMRITDAGDITVSGGDLFLNSGTSYNDKGVVYFSNERTAIISDIVNGTANGDTSLDFQTRKNGTRASALFIDQFRNVMIGTTTQAPSAQLTIALNDSVGGRLSLSNLRTALFDGDEFGRLSFVSNDSTQTGDRARISAVCRDTAAATDLVFYTGDGNAGVTDRMRITYNNLVCIGNAGSVATTTGWLFDAGGGGGMSGDFAGNNEIFSFNQINSSTVTQLDFRNGNIERGRIEWTTSGTTYNTTSDYRLKENVEELKNSLTEINKLKPKEFNFISNPDEKRIGFIAHEVEEIVPQAVSGIKDDIREDGTPKYQALDHSMLVPLLVGAIQELKAEIEILKNK